MKERVLKFFPSTRGNWIKYTTTSLPVIFSAMVFALNSFVDNFMAVKISGGNQALAYANTWTTLVTGIIAATTIIGSILFGQYMGKQDNVKIREVVRARMAIALIIATFFAIPALCFPHFMIKTISGFDSELKDSILNSAASYIRWIGISWIISAWGYTIAMILREAGYGGASLISSFTSLSFNIILNSIFIYGMNKGIVFLSYSTIISLIVAAGFTSTYIWIKDKRIVVNPLKLFMVSKQVWKQFITRTASFLLLSIGSLAISLRFVFWNIGYPTGSIGTNKIYELSAANILGISGMFFNIFWTTFESINANVAIFVGRELGNNNLEKAKSNAKELQGFHVTIAIIMGLIIFCLSFLVVKLTFLTEGYEKSLEENGLSREDILQGRNEFLDNLKQTLWPLSWNMPFWIWYITKSRIISGGGMTNITSLVDAISGIIQTLWIALINLQIVKTGIAFPWAYSIFFLSDLIKIPVFEILYYKLEWARNITHESEEIQEIIV